MSSDLTSLLGSDPSLDAHSRRVHQYAMRLANALGIHQDSLVDAIAQAALVHDIGKAAIPRHILDKRGSLTRREFEQVKRHVDIGAAMLVGSTINRRVIPIVRSHHENWDGTGYLRGLNGPRIPIGARIVSVVDCFDALTSDRPYRRKMPVQHAIQIVQSRRGTMYDPAVVDAFVRVCDHTNPLGGLNDFDCN